jgi:hypothetical protein
VTPGATFLALALTALAALGLVSEILVGEKLLFSRSEYEISAAIDALEYSILKLWHLPGSCFPVRRRTALGKPLDPPYQLSVVERFFKRSVIRNPGDSSSGFAFGPTPA